MFSTVVCRKCNREINTLRMERRGKYYLTKYYPLISATGQVACPLSKKKEKTVIAYVIDGEFIYLYIFRASIY